MERPEACKTQPTSAPCPLCCTPRSLHTQHMVFSPNWPPALHQAAPGSHLASSGAAGPGGAGGAGPCPPVGLCLAAVAGHTPAAAAHRPGAAACCRCGPAARGSLPCESVPGSRWAAPGTRRGGAESREDVGTEIRRRGDDPQDTKCDEPCQPGSMGRLP